MGGYDTSYVVPPRHQLCRTLPTFMSNFLTLIDDNRTILRDECYRKHDIMSVGIEKPKGSWVQTERAAHEAWAGLLRESPKAAEVLHLLVARVGRHNAVVISQKTLAGLMRCNERTVQRALKILQAGRWLEVRQIGDRGTVNAYVLNDRVVWTGPRDGIRYSAFSAAVIVSDAEQPDSAALGFQEPLRTIPALYRGERQLPSGNGLPPPSEPALPGFEPDLPALDLEQE